MLNFFPKPYERHARGFFEKKINFILAIQSNVAHRIHYVSADISCFTIPEIRITSFSIICIVLIIHVLIYPLVPPKERWLGATVRSKQKKE